MKVASKPSIALLGLAAVAAGASDGLAQAAGDSAANTPQYVCVKAAVIYRFTLTSNGNGFLIVGTRLGLRPTPILGSGFVNSNGIIVISWTEDFDFGSGLWLHPHGATVLKVNPLSAAPVLPITYDTTYQGNGAPKNVKGTAMLVDCPSSNSTTSDRNAAASGG